MLKQIFKTQYQSVSKLNALTVNSLYQWYYQHMLLIYQVLVSITHSQIPLTNTIAQKHRNVGRWDTTSSKIYSFKVSLLNLETSAIKYREGIQ